MNIFDDIMESILGPIIKIVNLLSALSSVYFILDLLSNLNYRDPLPTLISLSIFLITSRFEDTIGNIIWKWLKELISDTLGFS